MTPRFKVLITDHVPTPATVELEAFPQADFLYAEHMHPNERREALASCDAVLVWHERIDEQFLSQLGPCRIIVRYGVGFDNVDLSAVARRNIPFCNTPDYGTEEVADTACAMILGLQRHIHYYDHHARLYDSGWQDRVLTTNYRRLSQLSLGVVGVGRIGTAVISRMRGFGVRPLGFDPYQPSGHEKAIGYHRCWSLDELLAQADIVSINCPDNAETHGMINQSFLMRMKAGGILVNTARGGLISDLDAIYEALASGQLAAAGLDVLPQEPPPHTDRLIAAWRRREAHFAGRLIINPHAAFASTDAWREMRFKAAETARLYLERTLLRNRIA